MTGSNGLRRMVISKDFSHPSFPNSVSEPFKITSPNDIKYNCIAWACGDDTKWYVDQ